MSVKAGSIVNRVLVAIAAMAIFISTFGKGALAETAVDTTPVDFVLILDCSESMYDNDKEGWTAQATEDFVKLIGTENVRLAVIALGHDYGSDAYPVGQSDPKSRNRVKIAFPLSDATDDAREKAAAVIEEVTSQKRQPNELETMTPIGYALQAAIEILEEGDSADEKAAIILLSDGQVDGQTDYVQKGNKKDFKSIDEACDNAADHKWPIYCMELNYNNSNREGDGKPGIGYHQMRENIPSRTGTEPFEVESADKAKDKLRQIYNSFFEIPEDDQEEDSGIVKIPAKVPFTVGEMTAEKTVFLYGDVKQLESIGLISPDGTKTETYKSAQGNVKEKLRKIIFDDKSVVVKMVMPQEGEWILDLKGSGNVTLEYETVSLKQMHLVLESDRDGNDNHVSGEAVQFNAYFEYADVRYESADFFNKYPAVLHAGEQMVKMNSTENGYECSYQFPKMGTYPTYVQVDAPLFKNGYIRSGELTFNVENTQTRTNGEIPEQTCGVNESTAPLDLSKYFDAGDGDDLTYTIIKGPRDDFEYELSDDILILKAHETSKVFKLSAIASDGSGERGAEQKIQFVVINQPLQLLKSNGEQISLIAGSQEASDWILKAINADKNADTATFLWSEYFSDPDGATPDVRIIEDSNDGVVSYEQNNEGVTFKALKAGKAEYTIVAIDGNTDNVSQFIFLDINSATLIWKAVDDFKWILIPVVILFAAIIIGLIVTVFGRKIYGTWSITYSSGEFLENADISSYEGCNRSVVPIDNILNALHYDGDFPDVELVAGSIIKQKVYIRKMESMERVEYNGSELDDLSVKLEIKYGDSICLNKDGNALTLARR